MSDDSLVQEKTVQCPYCGESFSTIADASAGEQSYIEDCYVCCRPIEFHLHIDHDGDVALTLLTDDE